MEAFFKKTLKKKPLEKIHDRICLRFEGGTSGRIPVEISKEIPQGIPKTFLNESLKTIFFKNPN